MVARYIDVHPRAVRERVTAVEPVEAVPVPGKASGVEGDAADAPALEPYVALRSTRAGVTRIEREAAALVAALGAHDFTAAGVHAAALRTAMHRARHDLAALAPRAAADVGLAADVATIRGRCDALDHAVAPALAAAPVIANHDAADAEAQWHETLDGARGAGPAAIAARARRAPVVEYPHRAAIERSFGRSIAATAHVGPAATRAADALEADAFALGDRVAFATATPSLFVAAHEAAHTLQTTALVQRHAATGVAVGDDPYEAHADAVAQRVVRGQSAADLLDGSSTGAGHGIVRRHPKFDYEKWQDTAVGPKQYVRMNAKELYREVRSRLPVLAIGLPSEFIHFETDAGPFLTAVLDQSMASANHDYDDWPEAIRRAILPADLSQLVDTGRVITGTGHDDGSTVEYATGPLRWYPSAAAPVIEALLRRVTESLARIVPRYLEARCGAGIKPPDDGVNWAQPSVTSILLSHPCDLLVANALCTAGVVHVDGKAYRDELGITTATPAPAKVAPDLGPAKGVEWSFVDDPKNPNLIKITKPAGATAEQVAAHLFGSSQDAFRIAGGAPYFALAMGDALALRARMHLPVPNQYELLDAHLIDLSRDPSLALLRAGTADAVALSQASADHLVATVTDRGTVLRTLERTLNGLKACQTMARTWGTTSLLVAAIADVDGRMKAFATAPEADVAKWATQAEKQSDVVMRAAIGLDAIERNLKAMGLKEPYRIDGMTPVVRKPLEKVARELVDAAAISKLVVTGDDKVAAAERDLELAPLETLDAILADIRVRLHVFKGIADKYGPDEEGSPDLWDDEKAAPKRKYSQYQAAETEREMRREVTAIRALVLAHDPEAATRLKAAYERIEKLNVETNVGSTYAGLAYVFDAFLKLIGNGWTIIVGQGPAAVEKIFDAGKYQSIFKIAWQDCVQGHPEKATAYLKRELENDPVFATFLQKAFDKIDSIETRIMIAKIATMIGIAIVSMGVGALAEGGALALGAGEVTAFLASSAAESIAFTALDYKILGNDDVKGSLISNFVGNLVTFGVLKAWRLRKAAKIADDAFKTARLAEATRLEKLTGYLLKGKELTAEGVLIAAMAFAQTEIDAVRKTGKFLSLSEIRDAGKQGIAMMLGIAIGGRLFKTHLDELRKLGFKGTEKLVEKFEALKTLAKSVETTKDPIKALELVREDRALLEHELVANGYTTEAPHLGLKEAPKEIAGQVKQLDMAELGLALDEVVPGRTYQGTPEQLEPVLARLRDKGAEIKTVDEGGNRRYEVTEGTTKYTIHEARSYTVTRTGGAVAKQPLMRIEPNSVVGHVGSVDEGRAILRRLVAGDRTALHDLGYDSFPDGIKTSEVEWGLGRRWDGKLAVVLGSFREIDWSHLPHITPLSHTHPLTERARLVGADGKGEVSVGAFKDLDNDMTKLFPSAADISLMARAGIRDHNVHTGYVGRGGDRVANPRPGETGPTVDCVIERASYEGRWEGQEDIGVYKATITLRAGGKVIWRGEVWAVDAGASFIYRTKPKIAKSNLGPPGGKLVLGAGGSDKLREPLDGLYTDHVDAKNLPKDWQVKHNSVPDPDNPGFTEITTVVTVGGKKGTLTRSYNKKKNRMILKNIDVVELPTKVEHPGAMTQTGTPTSAYLTMLQMKELGVAYASVEKFTMTNVRNAEGVLEFNRQVAGGVDPNIAVRATKSVEYARTAIEQSGHQMVEARISVDFPGGKRTEAIQTVMDDMKVPPAKQKELLKTYGLKPTDKVVTGYNINIPVIPHPNNTPAVKP